MKHPTYRSTNGNSPSPCGNGRTWRIGSMTCGARQDAFAWEAIGGRENAVGFLQSAMRFYYTLQENQADPRFAKPPTIRQAPPIAAPRFQVAVDRSQMDAMWSTRSSRWARLQECQYGLWPITDPAERRAMSLSQTPRMRAGYAVPKSRYFVIPDDRGPSMSTSARVRGGQGGGRFAERREAPAWDRRPGAVFQEAYLCGARLDQWQFSAGSPEPSLNNRSR